jgi:hypothetical protein
MPGHRQEIEIYDKPGPLPPHCGQCGPNHIQQSENVGTKHGFDFIAVVSSIAPTIPNPALLRARQSCRKGLDRRGCLISLAYLWSRPCQPSTRFRDCRDDPTLAFSRPVAITFSPAPRAAFASPAPKPRKAPLINQTFASVGVALLVIAFA